MGLKQNLNDWNVEENSWCCFMCSHLGQYIFQAECIHS